MKKISLDNPFTLIENKKKYFRTKINKLTRFHFNNCKIYRDILTKFNYQKNKEYKLDTKMNGEERAYVVTGQYEAVFPFEIYPQQLVKSIMIDDVESMEELGIYEVAPEDFALCEVVCTSKMPVQSIVRNGLEKLRIESL